MKTINLKPKNFIKNLLKAGYLVDTGCYGFVATREYIYNDDINDSYNDLYYEWVQCCLERDIADYKQNYKGNEEDYDEDFVDAIEKEINGESDGSYDEYIDDNGAIYKAYMNYIEDKLKQ